MNEIRKGAKKFFLLVLVVACLPAGAQQSGNVPEASFTEQGTERCLDCHAGEKMTVVAESAHGNIDNPHSPYAQQGCESCHGKGSLHVSRARGGAGFPALIRFKRRGSSVEEQNNACLDCHAEDMGALEGMAWKGSLHDTGRMTCGSCHQMHAAADIMAVSSEQKATCAGCHDEQIEVHPKFENKGIAFDRLDCAACHDVHQLVRRPE